jgi:purine-nucleoside phosphorylase
MIPSADIEEARAFLRTRVPLAPDLAIVLGSGLGGFADALQDPVTIPSHEIPHYPQSTVEGHKGELVFGALGSKWVLAVRGRVHFYESGDLNTVLFPVRLLGSLGTRKLVITNAAGGVNRTFVPGDLMVLSDQLNLTGMRLPAGTGPGRKTADYYDPELRRTALATAERLAIRVVCGCYAGVKGPSYETASEVEMVHRLGGDAVGMSTVMETAMAVALDMKVLGISCITNKATGTSPAKLDHAEVTEVANRVKENFSLLLREIISRI